MARKPQMLKPYTAAELNAFASQLRKTAETLEKAAELMRTKEESEIYVMYPRRVSDTVEGANSVEKSVDKSYYAMLSGNPLTADSVSPRSVRKKRTEEVVDDAKEKLKKARAKKKPES